MTPRLTLLAVLLIGGCTDEVPPEADNWPTVPIRIGEAARHDGQTIVVSITGHVVRQDTRVLWLADETGAIRVVTPALLPELEDAVVGIRGVVYMREGVLEVRALEWTYDPTLHSDVEGHTE